MKKKLLTLAVGVVAACSVAFSQVPVSGTINGTLITGTVTNVNPNSTITVGTVITVQTATQIANFVVTTTPSFNPPGNISIAVNAINNAFNAFNVLGAQAGGANPNVFGSNTGEYSLNFINSQQIPFDLGLSAVLGAGAIAAVKTARKRRKEQAIA
ncbi:MAG: hypothetical protein JWR72_259 [Flavisolibacter sp.]|jgi:hypothetical protein|nr:hypothetical protein [Flavisolibacter sp.]